MCVWRQIYRGVSSCVDGLMFDRNIRCYFRLLLFESRILSVEFETGKGFMDSRIEGKFVAHGGSGLQNDLAVGVGTGAVCELEPADESIHIVLQHWVTPDIGVDDEFGIYLEQHCSDAGGNAIVPFVMDRDLIVPNRHLPSANPLLSFDHDHEELQYFPQGCDIDFLNWNEYHYIPQTLSETQWREPGESKLQPKVAHQKLNTGSGAQSSELPERMAGTSSGPTSAEMDLVVYEDIKCKHHHESEDDLLSQNCGPGMSQFLRSSCCPCAESEDSSSTGMDFQAPITYTISSIDDASRSEESIDHELDLTTTCQIDFSPGTERQLLLADHSFEMIEANIKFANSIPSSHVNLKETERDSHLKDRHSLTEVYDDSTFQRDSTFCTFAPVTPVIAKEVSLNKKHLARAPVTINLSPDAGINQKMEECELTSMLSSYSASSSESQVEDIQAAAIYHNVDWALEKENIASSMLGKHDARNPRVAIQEQLQLIVEDFQDHWKNDMPIVGPGKDRIMGCFRRTITSVVNSYCEQQKRRVRYLPDFCKQALSEWVAIEAHQQNPYPEKTEIRRLAEELGLTSSQVEQWFENYRVRNWKPAQSGSRKGKFFRYPPETTALLKSWIIDHKLDPNPRGEDLKALIEKTGMTSAQVKQWCYNFRRRHMKQSLTSL